MVSKGSAKANRETGTNRHSTATGCVFWTLSTSKMHLCLGLCPKPCWGSLERSPRPSSLLPAPPEPLSCSQPSVLKPPPRVKFMATPTGSVSNQTWCKAFGFKEKFETHCNDYSNDRENVNYIFSTIIHNTSHNHNNSARRQLLLQHYSLNKRRIGYHYMLTRDPKKTCHRGIECMLF